MVICLLRNVDVYSLHGEIHIVVFSPAVLRKCSYLRIDLVGDIILQGNPLASRPLFYSPHLSE